MFFYNGCFTLSGKKKTGLIFKKGSGYHCGGTGQRYLYCFGNVPDKVFASKIMGDGFAVVPDSDAVLAPADSEIMIKGVNLTTMVIFTAGYDKEVKLSNYGQYVKAGEILLS